MLVASPPHWPGLARALGHPELLEDPRFADRARHGGALGGADRAARRDLRLAAARALEEVLDHARITYGVIQTPEEAADDPQLRANDIVVPLDGVSETGRRP